MIRMKRQQLYDQYCHKCPELEIDSDKRVWCLAPGEGYFILGGMAYGKFAPVHPEVSLFPGKCLYYLEVLLEHDDSF